MVDAPADGPAAFPGHRVVIEFVHTAPEPMSVWLVLERGEVSVCHQHPGFETDVWLRASTPTFSDIFSGPLAWPDAVRSGAVTVSGPPRLVRALPTWFLWSPWAEVARERMARA